jgi:hypothetical protein
MAALQLEPGTLEDFRAFCDQTGASPELGLSVGDFTAAYAETPSEKLDEIVLVHGREWASAATGHAGHAASSNLPGLGVGLQPGNATSWSFDPSGLYGFDEAVLLCLVFVLALCCTAVCGRLRRLYRRCTSDEARQKRDSDTLGLIGDTARQISSDLDAKLQSMLHKSDGKVLRADATLSDLKFTELDDIMAKYRTDKDGSISGLKGDTAAHHGGELSAGAKGE